MTVKENNNCVTADAYAGQVRNQESQRMQLEQFNPENSLNVAANPTSNHLTISDGSCDMRSNSLDEYAQLAGFLQTRVLPGATQTGNGPDEE